MNQKLKYKNFLKKFKEAEIRQRTKKSSFFCKFIQSYCEGAYFHGFRYVLNEKIPIWQRLIWIVLIISTGIALFYVTKTLSYRYNATVLSTVIHSPHYSISNVPFPAVSICNFNRIDMHKFDAAVEMFIPNSSKDTQNKFQRLLEHLNVIRFGSFDKLITLRELDFQSMDHLNISEILIFTAYTCDQLLKKCWWRGQSVNCCDLFALQKTDYGHCYSFNSLTSDVSKFQTQHTYAIWPLRVYKSGIGSGLRVISDVNRDEYLKKTRRESGVRVIVHGNGEWPTNGNFIPSGSSVILALKPNLYKAPRTLRGFTPRERQCIFDNGEIWNNPYLKGLPYYRTNCIVDCRRINMVKYCNCSTDIFYPMEIYPPCNITGLICLSHYNDVLTYEKPEMPSTYFDDEEEGIVCVCLPECTRIEYAVSIKPNVMWRVENASLVDIDIFYKSQEFIKYQTYATFHFLSLLVSFGGMVAFFTGASIISGAEIVFYIIKFISYFVFRKRVSIKQQLNLRAQ